MSANTALVTDAAKDSAQQTLDDYSAGVSAHLGGDWGRHNQMKVFASQFREPVTGHVISTSSLRLALTLVGTANVVKIPIFATAETPSVGSPPIITLHPVSLTVAVGSSASFTVIGSTAYPPLTYQWRKNGFDLTGKTSATFTIPSVVTADQAIYSVVVSNIYGSITSSNATLTVTV